MVADRLLGLDVGAARIGVACADTERGFVFGRGVVAHRTQGEAVREIARLAAAEEAAMIVVGLPLRHDGRDSKQTQRVRAFARALEAAGLEVVFEDERFTTRLAQQQLREGAHSRAQRRQKGRLDEAAAMLILESHLARRRGEAEAP